MGKEAADILKQQYTVRGDSRSAYAVQHAYKLGGYKAVVRWQLSELSKKSKISYVSPVDLALRYAQLDDREKTLASLEEGYRQHSPDLLWIQCDPAYDFLHSDERYRAIIKGIGLPPAY
jgi:hypothetical protein